MDNYLDYLGGIFGVLTIAGIATASIYYFLARPIPEKPLVPLDNQSPILEVSIHVHICLCTIAPSTHRHRGIFRLVTFLFQTYVYNS